MPINPLIAQGITPLGEGVPQTLQAIQRNQLATRSLDANIQQDQQRNALYERQIGLQEGAQKNALDKQKQDRNHEMTVAAITHMRQNPALVSQIVAEGKRVGFIPPEVPDQLTPEQIEILAAKAGLPPAAPKWQDQAGPRGSMVQYNPQTGERRQVVGPDNSQPAPASASRVRTMNTQEIADAGLPPGTSAQVDANGKIDVISKRDNTGVLSQKDATTAKIKLNTVALARSQLNKIREAFEEGRKGVNAFGPGQGLLPTQQGKKFDARVDQMRSTLTALTRVPGVGAMSDYETKLDQSKFPARAAYETVTQDTINNLEDQLSLIENGYRDLLGGAAPAPTAPNAGTINRNPAPAAPGKWTVTAVQ